MTAAQRTAALSEFLGPQFKIFTAADGTPHSLATIHATENESKQVGACVWGGVVGWVVWWMPELCPSVFF